MLKQFGRFEMMAARYHHISFFSLFTFYAIYHIVSVVLESKGGIVKINAFDKVNEILSPNFSDSLLRRKDRICICLHPLPLYLYIFKLTTHSHTGILKNRLFA